MYVSRGGYVKSLLFAVLLCAGFAMGQESPSANPGADTNHKAKGEVTVQGCVSRSNGDYTLIKQDPGETYELQATGKIKLRHYIGQRVEVTGQEAPSMSTSSDSMARIGSASPVTISVSSIRTIAKECAAQ
jgi:hypothetical protein